MPEAIVHLLEVVDVGHEQCCILRSAQGISQVRVKTSTVENPQENFMQIHRARQVRLRTDSSNGRICSYCSRVMSLGYGFLSFIFLDYCLEGAVAYYCLESPAITGIKIVNRL